MRVVFAGTPEFSVAVLDALIKAGHEVIGVYCQPDRPKNRGRIITACAVKIYATQNGLSIYQPDNLQDPNAQSQLAKLDAEVMVVVAYGQLLPKPVLAMPKYGCLNIHASLLPRWRGASPIQHAILAGDRQTGVSIIQMSENLDAGNILLQKKCKITPTDTAQSLHEKLSILSAKAIIETLDNIQSLHPIAQDKSGITYAKKLSKDDAWIDWRQSAVQISRQIRAFNPYPIAKTHAKSNKFGTVVLRILSACIVNRDEGKNPGAVIKYSKGVCHVATGEGVLSLKKVQLPGKKTLAIKDFANARQLSQMF